MRRRIYSILTLVLVSGLMPWFTNCSSAFHWGSGSESSAGSVDTTSPAAVQAEQILSANCAGCHGSQGDGGLSNITDLVGLVENGFVIPGNAAGSPLIQKVTMSLMPPGSPLSASDQSALELWVSGNLSPAPAPSPSPPTSPSTGPTGTTASFADISTNVLTPNCVSCHGASVQNGGLRFDSYAGVMQAVQAGNLSGSLLYTQIASGAMPLNGPTLSTSDIETVGQWISNGAQNN